jgi:hypothetical protein
MLADRYRIGDALGRGRSTVYRATDERLQREVAVKAVDLIGGQEDAERVRTRAMREAQAAARLNNPHAVTVYDVIEESGAIWLVMELVGAPSLAQVVADDGPLGHRRAARIGLDVLSALEAAHVVGIVHRDVKPANVLVQADDHAKLTDFGVATIRDESRLTTTGLIVGSPSYMAPEQAKGAEIGPPTDLWALGALLYFATEGEPPFQSDSALATASAVVNGDPRPAQHEGPLTGLIGRLLTKDPAARATAGEARASLSRVSDGERTQITPAAPVSAPPGPPVPPAMPMENAAGSRAERRYQVPDHARGRLAVLAGVALVALLAAVAVAAVRGGGNDTAGSAGRASPPKAATTTTPPEPQSPTTAVPTTAPPPSTAAPAAGGNLPAGWVPYHDDAGGYSIGYPEGWQVVPAGGPRIDFRDPATGAFLRVDWTATPGSDPVADWRNQSVGFAQRHAGYQEIGIAPFTYRDYNAGLWEFRYGDPQVHVANLGFVTGGKGYALYFSAPEDQWAASQPTLDQFRQAFQPG